MTMLVTGASGNVGQQVVKLLLAQGEAVRVSSRNPENKHFPQDVEVVQADLNQSESLPGLLKGVHKVFLYAQPEGVSEFTRAAQSAGVQTLVVLSSSSVAHSDDFNAQRHRAVEVAIEEAGFDWTFLRPGAFAGNCRRWAPAIRHQGVVRLPYPQAHSTPIHEQDIAEVACKALTTSELQGQAPLLTGPASLTQVELVETIGQVLDKPIRFEELSPDQARVQMAQYMPAPYVEMLLSYWAEADGKPGPVSPDFERISGHSGRSFRTWVQDHLDDFRWASGSL